jgi:mRNA interferase RelE/StbE
MFRVTISKPALKVLEKINDPWFSQIKKAIYALSSNPRPRGYKKLTGRNGYRIRVADYRVIYEIHDDHLIVDIITIGHRKEIYN